MTDPRKKWAVVQELLPFGYRIDSTYRWKWRAYRKAAWSRYLEVHPLEWVKAENLRLGEPAQFDRELARYGHARRVKTGDHRLFTDIIDGLTPRQYVSLKAEQEGYEHLLPESWRRGRA